MERFKPSDDDDDDYEDKKNGDILNHQEVMVKVTTVKLLRNYCLKLEC